MSRAKKSPAKNLEATLLFRDFSKTFDSIRREKMEQIIIQAYGFRKEAVTAIMLFHLMETLTFSILSLESCKEISTIFIHTLLRRYTLNFNTSNKRKWFHFTKSKK